MSVDATFIGRKVFVHNKGAFDWSIFVDFCHDCFFVRGQPTDTVNLRIKGGFKPISSRSIVFVFDKGGGIVVGAIMNTFRCSTFFSCAGRAISVSVMLARFNHVRLATLTRM